jgi:hypothetical protein
LRYKVNGGAEMTEYALVRARSGDSRCGASPPVSMVRGSSATVVSAAMRIPFIGERSDAHPVGEIESNSTYPMALPFVDYFGANDGNACVR